MWHILYSRMYGFHRKVNFNTVIVNKFHKHKRISGTKNIKSRQLDEKVYCIIDLVSQ